MPTHHSTGYRGRFAPSPTGPLHFGSLLAAVASYLQARAAGGQWLLRIEDIDPPREVPGAAEDIVDTLARFGFEWDEEVVYQSQRIDIYREVLHRLASDGACYRCVCSRKTVQEAIAMRGGPPGVYPGTCLTTPPPDDALGNWRLATAGVSVEFDDRLQGTQRVRFGKDQGDFVVWRKDDLPSYQLAVTVDDALQHITEIVRGHDLLHETAGQHLLRERLGYPRPATAHIPVLLNEAGEKLSKQTGATALDAARVAQQLCSALRLLGLAVPAALDGGNTAEIWTWAIEHWSFKPLLNKQSFSAAKIENR